MYTTMAAPAYGTTTIAAPASYAGGVTYAAPAAQYTTAATYAGAPSYAAPVMQMETVAAPAVTYAAAAPTVVETVAAAPSVTYAAPTVVETVAAAPAVTYAAPVMTTQAPSYVAAPAVMPAMMPAPAMPMQPRKLTEGIPTPEQIAQQKAGYSAALDKQLKEAIETLQKETQIEKQMVQFNADKTIALYNMQVDERLTEALALADEEATFRLLELNKAKVERNLQLNNQANGLVMDYQMKAVQTELAQKQYAFQVEYMKSEGALEQQYAQQVAKSMTGTIVK